MLSKKQKDLIAEIWEGLISVADDIGADALLRWVLVVICTFINAFRSSGTSSHVEISD